MAHGLWVSISRSRMKSPSTGSRWFEQGDGQMGGKIEDTDAGCGKMVDVTITNGGYPWRLHFRWACMQLHFAARPQQTFAAPADLFGDLRLEVRFLQPCEVQKTGWTSADLRGGRSYLGFGAEVAAKQREFFLTFDSFCQVSVTCNAFVFQTYDCSHQPCWKLLLFFASFETCAILEVTTSIRKLQAGEQPSGDILSVEFLVVELLTFNRWSKPVHSMTKYSQWSSWIH